MQSESARMSSAHEAKFRVQYPNSRERAIKVIALDAEAACALEPVSREAWHGAAFFTSLSFAASAPKGDMDAWLKDVAGHALDLVSEVASADFIVVVACEGEDARAASIIADACKLHNKTLVGLVIPRAGASDEDSMATLKDLRPHARMLVVASDVGYIEAMLTALRA